MKSPRPVALVTGASAGIGAAIAREYARRGHDLVLTARRADRLQALAAELERAHGIRAHVLVADLADPAAPADLFARTQAAGIAVDVLVNNAGYGVPGVLNTPPWSAHRDFIEVLVTAPVALTYLYLPGMRERRRGGVLNVASLAGHMPGSAGNTLYGAAKAFMIRFSQSLALENRARGIRVSALCPGFTYSEFHDVSGARGVVSKMPDFMWRQADAVARAGIDALDRGVVVYVDGRINRAVRWLGKHLPDSWALALMARQSKRFRVQEVV
jgi:short-subunit dehydrogenase